MQYMILQRADARTEQGEGLLPGMQALASTDGAVRLTLADGKATIVDGPFDDYATVAGFTAIEAASKEDAVAQASRWPLPDGVADATLELRPAGCPGGCAAVPDQGKVAANPRFAVLLRSSPDLEAEAPVAQAKLDALNEHNAAEVARGVLVSASGLHSTAQGARVKRARSGNAVMDGPFTEIKELIAGYWMIEVPSLQDAIAWALRNPYPTGPNVEVEIRAVRAPAAQPFTPELQVQEQRMREAQLESALRAELAGGR